MATLVATGDIPEVELADAEYPDQRAGSCSCHSIREGAGGASYSFAMLGVNCSNCEAFMYECESADAWNSLTRDERIADRVQDKRLAAEHEARRAAEASVFGGEEPPF